MKARRFVRALGLALALAAGTATLAGLPAAAQRSGGPATTVQANTSWGWPVCVGTKLPLDACKRTSPFPTGAPTTPHTTVPTTPHTTAHTHPGTHRAPQPTPGAASAGVQA
ncbi:hypothetical protein [Kitasatospora sp. LaBMicrA B282]|uniref:hypothetical protein n=1 Tax=Kitasatospora sp. LaBMicrA B282 TaxID=3420949 RepID=UPI003D14D0FB